MVEFRLTSNKHNVACRGTHFAWITRSGALVIDGDNIPAFNLRK